MMQKLSDAIRNWFIRDGDRTYVNQLADPQLEDLGVTRFEGKRLAASRADTRQRLLAMAAHYGLGADDVDTDRQVGLDIALACGRCDAARICGRFLAGRSRVSPDTFCPNAARYKDLAASS